MTRTKRKDLYALFWITTAVTQPWGNFLYLILSILSGLIHSVALFFKSVVVLTLPCQFLLYSKVNEPYAYTYPLFFGFPSHLNSLRRFSFIHTLLSIIVCRFFDGGHSDQHEMIPHYGFDLYSLLMNDVEHIFMFISHLYVFFGEMSV